MIFYLLKKLNELKLLKKQYFTIKKHGNFDLTIYLFEIFFFYKLKLLFFFSYKMGCCNSLYKFENFIEVLEL